MTQPPRRLLLVSATIGEGHNATARAVEEAARARWPECTVTWADALELMGSWVPRTFQRIYVTNVESTPWLYDFFYAALWRQRWFADGCRRFVGSWCGRRLRPLLAARRPDLIVSTYPLGTAGLDWLRRRGELDAPIAAVISDFAPHPFWVYSEIDLHYVMSENGLRAAHRAQPRSVHAVSAPPVETRFRPREKSAARRDCGLPTEGRILLISCGSLGFGSVERAADAALRTGIDHVVVLCGHNEPLLRRLRDRAEQDARLIPLSWVRDVPAYTAAADVVVTNAGGATALEALACGRPVLMVEPIAGHGRANARLMAEAGLAELCEDGDALTRTLHLLITEPAALRDAEQRVLDHLAATGRFADQVAELAHLRVPSKPRRLRGQDAFFVHADTPVVPQQTGAVLSLSTTDRAMTTADWIDHLGRLISTRAPDLPMLRHRLSTPPGHRPYWVPVREFTVSEHLSHHELRTADPAEREKVEREFFTAPLRRDRPPWSMKLVRRPGAELVTILVKMHHALGDGLVMTSSLLRLLADSPPQAPAPVVPVPSHPRRAAAVLRGLLSLAATSTAPTATRGSSTSARRFAWLELPAEEVRACAAAHRVSRSALLLATLAEALHRLDENNTTQHSIRAMVPRSTGEGNDEFGNHTAGVPVDLPLGQMVPRRRLNEVAARLAHSQGHGRPAAAAAVLRALAALPAPLHAEAVRATYRARFFRTIVSIMPGGFDTTLVAGAPLHTVHPVLPLADGVGLAVGMFHWNERTGIGVTTDPGLFADVDELADQLRHAFTALRDAEPADVGS
ncbi:MGDG synthase family glycosyltransferase [Saccharopolyspora gloriosae]|uniref:MGDG synthase family glycosyltransferase n=1 Tax=Saccharopolyspora gloriosae TaxID=455344 RepID=UPI001FB6C42B|nr:wax ester/triacylglycerol synthase domain-containing protein [Saccharopolyspora gloriosae]